jgi:hypothetical protein
MLFRSPGLGQDTIESQQCSIDTKDKDRLEVNIDEILPGDRMVRTPLHLYYYGHATGGVFHAKRDHRP